jgi:hypothetical protein
MASPAILTFGILSSIFGLYNTCQSYYADRLAAISELIWVVRRTSQPQNPESVADGIAMRLVGNDLYALNRTSGALAVLPLEPFVTSQLPDSLRPGVHVFREDITKWNTGYHFNELSWSDSIEVFEPLPPVQ